MENIQPQEVPELEQPDFLAELESPKPKREARVISMEDVRPSGVESGPVCPECENHDRNCTRCYGRNYSTSK